MRQTTITALALLALTAILGLAISYSGGYPPRDNLAGLKADLYQVITFPLFFAGIGTLITVPMIVAKREHLSAEQSKTRMIPTIGILLTPFLMLMLQILMPLEAFDIITDASSDLIFYGFIVLFFAVLGNYVVTIPPGSRLGFRNRWTNSDVSVWTRTHRFLGTNIMLTALVLGPAAAFLDRENANLIFIGGIGLIKGISYLYARRLGKQLILRDLNQEYTT